MSSLLVSEIKKIIKDSEIMKEDDTRWPQKNKDGKQELEIKLGSEHISFEVSGKKLLDRITDQELYRLPKLALWWMSRNPMTQKDCEYSTIWYRT